MAKFVCSVCGYVYEGEQPVLRSVLSVEFLQISSLSREMTRLGLLSTL